MGNIDKNEISEEELELEEIRKLDEYLKNKIDNKNEISEEESKPPKTTEEHLDNSNDDKESILKPPTLDEQELKSKSLTSHIKPDNEEWKEGENLLCPFGEDSYTTTIPDEMYAHISINHKLEKGRPSSHKMTATHFLLKNLSHRVSKQCFLCTGTNFEYKDRQKLREHYQICHSAAKEYEVCTHCDRRMLKRSLKKHLNDLKAEKTSCEICGQMYTPVNLVKHKRIVHSDKEAVQCPTCEKVFYWSEEKKERGLKEHIQSVHERFKPFACEICGKKMAKYNNLDEHRIKVHGSKKMSIGTYREMIESGNYKFLNNLPTNLDYSGLIIKSLPTGNSELVKMEQ